MDVGALIEAAYEAKGFYERQKLAALAAETVLATAELAAAGSTALTFWAVVSVFMALGSGYQETTEEVRDDNAMAGFTQGFVMGLLGWTWHSAVGHLGRHYVVRISTTDPGNDVVRVNAYNRGLRGGYFYASAFPESFRKPFAVKLHKMAGAHVGDWTENDKISYVIELAAALKRLYGW